MQSRFDILKIHSRRMNLMRGIDLKKISEKMNGASGAELKVCFMLDDCIFMSPGLRCYLLLFDLSIVGSGANKCYFGDFLFIG